MTKTLLCVFYASVYLRLVWGLGAERLSSPCSTPLLAGPLNRNAYWHTEIIQSLS